MPFDTCHVCAAEWENAKKKWEEWVRRKYSIKAFYKNAIFRINLKYKFVQTYRLRNNLKFHQKNKKNPKKKRRGQWVSEECPRKILPIVAIKKWTFITTRTNWNYRIKILLSITLLYAVDAHCFAFLIGWSFMKLFSLLFWWKLYIFDIADFCKFFLIYLNFDIVLCCYLLINVVAMFEV